MLVLYIKGCIKLARQFLFYLRALVLSGGKCSFIRCRSRQYLARMSRSTWAYKPWDTSILVHNSPAIYSRLTITFPDTLEHQPMMMYLPEPEKYRDFWINKCRPFRILSHNDHIGMRCKRIPFPMLDYHADIRNIDRVGKRYYKRQNAIAVVVSDLIDLDCQVQRVKLLRDAGKEVSGLPIHIYGRDVNGSFLSLENYYGEVSDKGKLLRQYRYCLCIENSNEDNYTSEKPFDAILSGCITIYHGSEQLESHIFSLPTVRMHSITLSALSEACKKAKSIDPYKYIEVLKKYHRLIYLNSTFFNCPHYFYE